MAFITAYFIFAISLFSFRDIDFHITAAIIVAAILISLPFKKVRAGLLPITVFLAFTFLGNLFFHHGRLLYDYGFLSITDEGFNTAAVRTLRVFSMVYAAKILTHMLPLEEMVKAMDRMLRPLERRGIPVSGFFHMTGLTLKAFPVLIKHISEEYKEIMKSKDVTGFRNSIRYTVSLMMPVFVRTIQSPESFFSAEGDAKKN